ncbi:MAG: class I tRNA ligase family protein, partial [Ginsengibacter sp.]
EWSMVNSQKKKDSETRDSPFTIHSLRQDEDVLDTWFSSWLWPMEVFNGITQPRNKDINYYYPTSVLVTGQDIIFFWVARMIMSGMEYMKEKPFSDVYFTGMVRDKQGRKMSKSLGNSPDLLHLIHEYGADAVRFGIMISSPAGNDLLFDEASLEQGKFFNNKIWNALKLVKMWELRQDDGAAEGPAVLENSFAVSWFENRSNEVFLQVENLMSQFKLSEALKIIYSLIWDDFCSWFLEWIKPGFDQKIDAAIYTQTVLFFERLMQLLHPFMPFITEEIYHLLQERNDDLIVKQFSQSKSPDESILAQGLKLKELITAIRDARNKHNIKPKETIQLFIETGNKEDYAGFETILKKQSNAESIIFSSQPENASISVVAGKEKIYITANIEIDVTAQKEKLLKDLNYLKGFLNSIDKKLSNDRFVQNASPEVIGLERKKKSDTEARILVISESLSSLR